MAGSGGRAEGRGVGKVDGREEEGVTRGGWWGGPGVVAGVVPADEGWSGPTVRSSNTPQVQDHFPENEIKRNCIELSPMQINQNLSGSDLLEM